VAGSGSRASDEGHPPGSALGVDDSPNVSAEAREQFPAAGAGRRAGLVPGRRLRTTWFTYVERVLPELAAA